MSDAPLAPPPIAEELRGSAVTVMGLGLFGGGAAATRWLVARGAHVTVTDLRDERALEPALRALEGLPVEWRLGSHCAEDFEECRWVVANPAVRPDNPWLARARAAGAGVTSELELFLLHVPARVVLVTGTQGKSSTTHFLGQLLARAGLACRAGGNIGRPLLAELDDIGPDEICVVEASSYQLEALTRLPLPARPGGRGARVVAAVVTNLRPDHLERHGTLGAYAAAKARVLDALAPGGTAWLPAELAARAEFADRLRDDVEPVTWGADDSSLARVDGRFRLGREDLGWEDLGAEEDLAVPGGFQRQNALVALGVARRLGAAAEELGRALPTLTGLPHRLEPLATTNGVRVLDNGVSTTPDSTLAALESIAGEVTLLVGGQRKRDLPFDELARAAAARGARVVTFGAAGAALGELFRAAGVVAETVETVAEATRQGLAHTPAGGTLLFSPACASFDGYLNFRDRALDFRRALLRDGTP